MSLPLTALRQQTHLWKVKTDRWCNGQISLAICFNPSHSRIMTVSQPINTQWPPYPFLFSPTAASSQGKTKVRLFSAASTKQSCDEEKKGRKEQSEAIQSAD